MTFLTRIGLALVKPRGALQIAGERQHAGRAGSDLIAAIAMALVVTQLRWVAAAGWLGAAVDAGLGLRALIHILTRALTVDLSVLTLAASAIWLGAGQRRELGRAFDLACVAFVPVVAVRLLAQVIIDLSHRIAPAAVRYVIDGVAYSWLFALVVVAVAVCRRESAATAGGGEVAARRVGWVLTAVAGIGLTLQLVWLGGHGDAIRPLTPGATAPPLGLSRIGVSGPVGSPVIVQPGDVTIVEFWATWCAPCRKALPNLDAIARRHPEVRVYAVNLDDAGAARALFDAAHYAVTLLADDGVASERYGVTSIPHTVVIDRNGSVRAVARGTGLDLEAEIRAAMADPL